MADGTRASRGNAATATAASSRSRNSMRILLLLLASATRPASYKISRLGPKGSSVPKVDGYACIPVPKDKLVAPAGALSEVATFPRVAELSSGLPSPQWASDHALTTAVLTHPPGPAERV